ncbi:MAG: 3-deoxy-7-phosphoheptulonate synthase [Clostridia bacterium]|nr:3-deoxy-7-phosphoheptulonate synthase [Oscillospiraceae bacterium]MBR4892517.1 3-deoxy-7-phosphoheptulonate synthase [Clostridia bacterium]
MVLTTKSDIKTSDILKIKSDLESKGLEIQINYGAHKNVIALLGDVSLIDTEQIIAKYPFVEQIIKISEPYKKANRRFKPDDTVIKVANEYIGGDDKLTVIAGPCSVESREQVIEIAKGVKSLGAKFLRGGAYKPRTSPYAFQGMGLDGLKLLKQAKDETGLPIVSEIMSASHLDEFVEFVDILQVGARNMQNFELLKQLGKLNKPILIKRGLSNTIEELLMAAEYVMSEGNGNVILCERGIRTFETFTRNTLDLSAIPALKRLTHLPVIIDPSHATGMSWMVEPMAKAAVAAGANGLIIEVHNDPKKALCDGPQSLTIDEFGTLMSKVTKIAQIEGKTI